MCSHTVWSTLRTVWHDALRAGFFKIAPDPSRLVTPPVIEESTENFREALTNIACQATSLQENFNRSNVQPIEQPMLEIGLHSDNLQLFNVGFCLDYYGVKLSLFIALFDFTVFCRYCILGDPGAASRDDGIFMGESLQRERESPGHLLLPIQFQKRLNSLLLIGQKNTFLVNQRRGTAGRLSCLLTRGCFPHRSPW